MSDVCQVMHRDLKLENILVKSKHPEAAAISDFEFKIGDMGLAKGHSGDHLLYGTICGSPLYMAPEVLMNQPYNHSADIWSLGTMLYHLLTGNYPFEASSLTQLKRNIQLGVYWIPKNVRLSSEVTQFLNCCLQIDHKNRIGIRELKAHPFYTSKRLMYPEVTEEEFKQGKRMDARLPEKL